MAVATLAVQQFTGGDPTKTTVTTPRLSTADSNNPGTTYPIPIPAADFNYSFWQSLHLTCTNIGDATLLNNHKFYSDGTVGWTLGTGGGLLVCIKSTGDCGVPVANYDQATGTQGTTGDYSYDETDGHAYYKTGTSNATAPVSAATYTSGSQLTVDTGSHTSAEGFKGVVLQAKVADDATRGVQTAETLTFVYDEI